MKIFLDIIYPVLTAVVGVLIPIAIKYIIAHIRYYKTKPAIIVIINSAMAVAEEKYIKAFRRKHKWNTKSLKYVYDFIIEQTKLHMTDDMFVNIKNYIHNETIDDWIMECILYKINNEPNRTELWSIK